MNTPTLTLYSALQEAFDHFNQRLFGGALPQCLITLRSASRVYGYHHADRFISPDGNLIAELGIHPGFFTLQPIESVMSTLVHEMVHHWQHHAGSPSVSNPHNREWADKMVAIGLQPSSTGLPGGKRTGRSVSDYILRDGDFLAACRDLVAQGFALPWLDRHVPALPLTQTQIQQSLETAGVAVEVTAPPVAALPAEVAGKPSLVLPPPKKAKTRFKFVCLLCSAGAWAAEEAKLYCGVCMLPLAIERE
jgi:hypothetical protein